MPAFNPHAYYSQYIPILGPLGARFCGGIDANVHLTFGMDTLGIEKALAGGGLGSLAEGVFVDPSSGLSLSGGIAAGLELNLGYAEADVTGGIYANVNFTLHDPNHDGKVRLSEIASERLSQIFDRSGEMDAGLRAHLKIGFEVNLLFKSYFVTIFEATYEIASVKILDFGRSGGSGSGGWTPSQPPVLATLLPGGTLRLNMGPNASARQFGNLTDGGETFEVAPVPGVPNAVDVTGSVDGYDLGTRRYAGVTGIVADGGAGDDWITINPGVTVPVTLHGGTGNDTLRGGSGPAALYGDDRDDQLYAATVSSSLYGGNGSDTLYGGGGNDYLSGGAGDDFIEGRSGGSTLDGGAGKDSLYGGNGSDVLLGGDGDDLLQGNGGNDTLYGGAGSNRLYGGDGNDLLYASDVLFSGTAINYLDGGAGDDTLYGAGGPDTLVGGYGDDVLYGEGGGDYLSGGAGNDHLYAVNNTSFGSTIGCYLDGGAGDDTLYGAAGPDTLVGGFGNDWLYGEGGADYLTGGAGNDHLFAVNDTSFASTAGSCLDGGDGNDVLWGSAGSDTLVGGTGNDTIYGQGGNDVICAGTTQTGDGSPSDTNVIYGDNPTNSLGGNGTIYGDAGNDTLYGGSGSNVIYARAGDDLIVGGAGDDFIDAGPGNDTLYGAAGNDTLFGSSGNDVLVGGPGDDALSAGSGNNLLVGGGQLDSSGHIVVLGPDQSGNDVQIDVSAFSATGLAVGSDGLIPTAVAGSVNGIPGDGDDLLQAGPGINWLFGGSDADALMAATAPRTWMAEQGRMRSVRGPAGPTCTADLVTMCWAAGRIPLR